MRRFLALLCLAIAGCRSIDPATSRLESGNSVVVFVPPPSIGTMIKPINSVPFDKGSAAEFGALTSGDECMVISDEDSATTDRLTTVEITKHKHPLPQFLLMGVRCRVERKFLRLKQEAKWPDKTT